MTPVAIAAEVGHQRVVGVQDEARARRVRAATRAPPSGPRAARARRSGRAGRGRGWRAAAGAGATARATAGSQASSTSNSPSLARRRGPRRAAPWPRPSAMFEPARLWTTGRRSRSSAAASIAAVVVLPLVAEISTEPSSRLGGHARERARGQRRSSSRPGAVVPPLRPSRRLAARDQHGRARERGRASGRGRRHDDPQAARLDGHGGGRGCRSGRRRRRSSNGRSERELDLAPAQDVRVRASRGGCP